MASKITRDSRIVEFFGLPGSGKSTLAAKTAAWLAQEACTFDNPLLKLKTKSLLYRSAYKMFILCRQFISSPRSFFVKFGLLIRTEQRSLSDLLKVTINFFLIIDLLSSGKRSNKNLFLDQGIFQVIWSINLFARKKADVGNLLEGVVLPDLVVVLDINQEIMAERLRQRDIKESRLENKFNLDEAGCKVVRIYSVICGYLENTAVEIIRFENNRPEDLENNCRILRQVIKEFCRPVKWKVAHILTRLTLGGAQENTFYCLNNHNRNKYETYLVTGEDNSFGGTEYLKRLTDSTEVCKISSLQNRINPLRDLRAFIDLCRFIRNKGLDIVHTHSSKAGVLGRLAGRLMGARVVVHTVHGWSFHDRMDSAHKKLYIMLERMAAFFCDRLITVTKQDINKGLREKIAVSEKYATIRSGIDFTKFSAEDCSKKDRLIEIPQDKKIIGTVGRLSEQKNPLDFLRIAEELLKKRQDIHFMVIGDGPLRKQAEDYIRANGLEKDVTLLGVRSDVFILLHWFDIFLLTSLWEGLPRVILEAMYCKVPVVANDVDGVAEIIKSGENGFSQQPFDLLSACNNIEQLLDNEKLRKTVTENAFRTVFPEYGAQYMVSQLEDLYESIMLEHVS